MVETLSTSGTTTSLHLRIPVCTMHKTSWPNSLNKSPWSLATMFKTCQLRIDKVELLPSKRKPIQEARTTRVIGVILLAPLQINTLFENFN